MKSRLPINAILTPKQIEEVKAFAHEIAQEEFERLNKQATRRIFQLLAVSLNEMFGFGQSRITRLFGRLDGLMCIHKIDTEFWEHITRRCRQIGVEFTDREE